MPQRISDELDQKMLEAFKAREALKIAIEAMQTAVDYYDKPSWMMGADDMTTVLRNALERIKGIG